VARNEDQGADDHQRCPAPDPIREMTGKWSADHRREDDDGRQPAGGGEHVQEIAEDAFEKAAISHSVPSHPPRVDEDVGGQRGERENRRLEGEAESGDVPE